MYVYMECGTCDLAHDFPSAMTVREMCTNLYRITLFVCDSKISSRNIQIVYELAHVCTQYVYTYLHTGEW